MTAMRSLGLIAIPVLAIACQRAGAEDQKDPTPPKKERAKLDDKAALLDPIQVDSLTLTPIIATDAGMPKDNLDVLTLDEAFTLKKVAIKEQPSETVNSLTLTNLSNQPLFLLAGEVILGGKQDRIIGQNTVVEANTTMSVPVFCVEHGRWNGETTEFTSGKALAHGRLRGKASFENQQEVWNEVSAKNELRKTATPTGTYRLVADQQANGQLAGSEQRVRDALAKVDRDERGRMIGYVVALNGKVATIDRFSSPGLFKKLENKLVRSYLTESIDIAAEKNIAAPTPTQVQTFMKDADRAVEEKSYENAAAATTRYKGAKAAKAKVELKKKIYEGKMAKPESPVYETYQAK
jgi:ARG/rhodanese/phosphatase superfamily protein